MATVLLFVIEDNVGPGIRCLGSYIKQFGHRPYLVFLEKSTLSYTNVIPDKLNDTREYKTSFVGFNLFKFGQEKQKILALPRAFLNFCSVLNPDIIGFSTRFIEKRFVKFFDDLRIASPDSLLISGGHGPSVYTKEFLSMDVDLVIRGEGEEALAKLADAIDNHKSWKEIPNIAYKDDAGQIIKNKLLHLIDVNAVPLPLYDDEVTYSFENNIFQKGHFKDRSSYNNAVLAGRGCIGSCSYCAANLWRNIYSDDNMISPKHRRLSNKNLMLQALLMKKRAHDGIMYIDDYFIRPYNELKEFFSFWQENIKLPFYAHFSLEQLKKHPDLVQLAIDSGLSTLLLAQQTADEDLAKEIFHRSNDNKAILKFFVDAHKQYVQIQASFIDGYLFNNKDDLESKLAFIKQLPFDPAFYYGTLLSVFQLRVHPGSPLDLMWNNLNADLLPTSEMLYRAMLLHFRLITNDYEFNELRMREDYRKYPQAMLPEFHRALKLKQIRYIRDAAKRLKGHEVYFYGAGQVYQANKALFAKSYPKAILLDNPKGALYIDNLPVLEPAEILNNAPQIPIVIFGYHAMQMARKIKKLRPDYQRENIVACEAIHW